LLSKFCKEIEKLNLGWVSNTEVIAMEVDSTLEQDIGNDNLKKLRFMNAKNKLRKISL
jgi:hypothetical protein